MAPGARGGVRRRASSRPCSGALGGRPGVRARGRRPGRARPRRARARARRARRWAGGAGAAGGGPRRARRRAGDARRVRAAVRAGLRRPRPPRPAPPVEGGATSRSGARRRSGSRRRTARATRASCSRTRASFAPVRVRVTVRDRFEVRTGEARRTAPIEASAEAELAPPGELAASGGGYDGPLAERQGERMRPDVARAFDRMERAARADGVALLIISGFRSDAEQAVLYARHPDPRWVAPPGRSLHRLGTELDLGPPAAYGWLAAHAERFHFTKRYAWEPWHFGYTLNARSSPAAAGRRRRWQHAAELRPRRVRAGARARRAALERLGDAARRAAVRGEQLQPVRGQPRGRAGDRAVHARHRARRWGCATRSTPSARSTRRRA